MIETRESEQDMTKSEQHHMSYCDTKSGHSGICRSADDRTPSAVRAAAVVNEQWEQMQRSATAVAEVGDDNERAAAMNAAAERAHAVIVSLRDAAAALQRSASELETCGMLMTPGALLVSSVVDEIGGVAVICSAVTAVLCDSHPVDSLTDEQAVDLVEQLRSGVSVSPVGLRS